MQFKFKLFSSNIEGELEAYEELMTRATNNPDDINIVLRETKLTEMGQYLIALHWIEVGDNSADKMVIREMTRSGL
jgi:hypothetical protein